MSVSEHVVVSDPATYFRPNKPRIVNGFVEQRTEEDQVLIDAVANAFLETRQRTIISSILAVRPDELKFTQSEAEIIRVRHDAAFITGTAIRDQREPVGFPIMQFYDFCLTIDNAITFMRGLDIEIKNLNSIGSLALVDRLKEHILHTEFIPWAIADAKEFYKYIPSKHTLQLGSRSVPTYDDAKNQWNEDAKNDYQKCCDETLVLSSGIIRILIGLSQGLFMIFNTSAKHFKTVMVNPNGPPQLEDEFIPIGSWINATKGKEEMVPYFTKELQAEYKSFGDDLIFTERLFLAGENDITKYPGNWPYLFGRFVMKLSDDELKSFWKPATKATDIAFKYPRGGGPIRDWNFYISDTKSDENNVFPFKPPYEKFKLLSLTDEAKYSDWINNVPKPAHTEWNTVWEHMNRYTHHPIWVCPALSKAYAASGVSATLWNMYTMLQRNFAAALKTVDSMTTSNVPDSLRLVTDSHKALSYLPIGSCPNGTIPQYREFSSDPSKPGDIVDEDEAVKIVRDPQTGQVVRILKGNIDPSQCSCVPLVRAPTFTIPTSEYRNVRLATKQEIPMPKTMGVLSKADIERQLGQSGGMLQMVGQMSANVVPRIRTLSQKTTRIGNPDYRVIMKRNSRGFIQRYWVKRG